MPTGSTTINFGGGVGSQSASAVVTGQAGIVSGSHVEAFLMAETSADHNAQEHMLAALLVGLTCGQVVAGTGFTIFARSEIALTGAFTIRWVWV